MSSRGGAAARRPPLAQTALTLATLIGLMAGLRVLFGEVGGGSRAEAATVALGFLLLSAVLAGKVTEALRLPRITGYILLGVLVGPSVLDLVTEADVADLRLVDGIAISLIAFSAGGELRLAELRARGRVMGTVMATEMLAVFVIVAGGVLLLAGLLPFTQGRDLATVATIALVFGSIAIANSPSVAIAVINDTRSRGPVASTILGVTVLKDVVVILFFAVALAVARTLLSPERGFETAFLLGLGWEIGGSILLGAASGWIVSLYLRRLRVHLVVFALAFAFLNAHLSEVLHLEVLIVSLTAGFFLENVSPVHGEPFIQALEANSLPLYALFFSLAGASLHLADLIALWPVALALVLLRAGAIFLGTWTGARLAGAEPEVRRYAWLGFISQAGVTLGMVIIAERAFPEWGGELKTLFVAMVAIHELIGPVLLQHGLRRSGEVGRRDEPGRTRAAPADDSRLATVG